MAKTSLVSITILCVSLSACGQAFWATRATDPVITDTQSPSLTDPAVYGVISTTAGRRSVFIRYADPRQSPGQHQAMVCAEPPPDAVDALANALTVTASGNGGSSSPQGKLSLANSFAVNSGLGLYRSQGLQVLRDQTFQLCIRAMETNMTPDEWYKEQKYILDEAVKLIDKEMDAIKIAAGKTPMIVTAADPFSPTTTPNKSGDTTTSTASKTTTTTSNSGATK